MTFKKLVLGRSLLYSALLTVQQRPNILATRNKLSTTSSDEISDNVSADKKIEIPSPRPPNLTLIDIQYLWLQDKAIYYEELGGYGFCELNDIEKKVQPSVYKLSWDDEKKLQPNREWAKEFFNQKDTLIEIEKASFRKMYATFRLICKIEDIARRLVDENVIDKCHIFYHVEMYDKDHLDASDYEECWASLLKSSQVPLSVELRHQLKEADITESEFSEIISKMYNELLGFDTYKCFQIEPIGREDVIDVLADLKLDEKSYNSIKILFNFDEPVKWRL